MLDRDVAFLAYNRVAGTCDTMVVAELARLCATPFHRGFSGFKMDWIEGCAGADAG
jgi:hypothetical protein